VVLPAGISGAPRNVIAVNTVADVGNLLDWIESSFLHDDGNAVVCVPYVRFVNILFRQCIFVCCYVS
jgi:hypothetical protein